MLESLFYYFLPLFLGILFGFITGFTPGLHVNNVVSIIIILNSNLFLYKQIYFFNNILLISPFQISIFIISMAITHTITEIFPNVLLGVPDNNTFISLLPVHKLFLKGEAYTAIIISVFSSFLGGFLSIILLFFSEKIIFILNFFLFEKSILLILILIYFFLLSYNFSFKNFLSFFFSSLLGLFSLKKNFIIPLLSGLFGLPFLFESLNSKNNFIKQKFNFSLTFFNKNFFLTIFFSLVFGIVFSFLPGTGTSIASFFIILFLNKIIREEYVIVSNSSISTVNFIFSIYTFYYNDSSRNGAILGVKNLLFNFDENFFLIVILVSIIVLSLSTIISLFLSKKIVVLFSKLSYKQYKFLTLIIILFNFLLVFYSNNILGVIFLFFSFLIGYFSLKNKVEKVKLLSSLLLPTILLKLRII